MASDKIKNCEKEDIKFKIQFDQSNRDFLTTLALFYLNIGIASTAVIISILTFLFSTYQRTNSLVILLLSIVLVALFILLWCWCGREAKKGNGSAIKLNKQLQDRLFKIYPEYRNEHH